MTIREAINQVDSRLPNVYLNKDKLGWLNTLDMQIMTQIIETHENAESTDFAGYTVDTDLDTKLLVAAPYDELYLRHLEAMIHYYNQEEDRCNNATDAFNALYRDYVNYYNRNHMPKGQRFTV